MIKIENLHKTFHLTDQTVNALDGVSLEAPEGTIYGVIGFSGAGKSTLVRCINFLEYPDEGSVTIDGFGEINAKSGVLYKDGAKISEHELRKLRKNIGMIFQHFNLMDRSTVLENVEYPLRYTGKSQKEIKERGLELLELVGLSDKAYAYPSQLSGGQKQRVAIARALANKPKILLCDEATSALDPEATDSVLALLKDLNEKLNLTIILITHEMAVIKAIAKRVAVMENGRIIEQGDVYEVFSGPQADVTKRFLDTASSLGNITGLLERDDELVAKKDNQILLRLTYTKDSVGDALISKISRDCDVDINIVLANIDIIQEEPLGGIIVSIQGPDDRIERALQTFKKCEVRTEEIAYD
jgi:D-methionine transport system ATP-binding protein